MSMFVPEKLHHSKREIPYLLPPDHSIPRKRPWTKQGHVADQEMAQIMNSDEFLGFTRWNTQLRRRVRQWPRHDDNDLTTYIPGLIKILRSEVLPRTNSLQRLVADTDLEGDSERETCELKAIVSGLAEGLRKLSEMLSEFLVALSSTYQRLHGRDEAPSWEQIEGMWPLCSGEIFQTPVRRLNTNDFIDNRTSNVLKHVFSEVGSMVTCLHSMTVACKNLEETYKESGRALEDPHGLYYSDADDEAESVDFIWGSEDEEKLE